MNKNDVKKRRELLEDAPKETDESWCCFLITALLVGIIFGLAIGYGMLSI